MPTAELLELHHDLVATRSLSHEEGAIADFVQAIDPEHRAAPAENADVDEFDAWLDAVLYDVKHIFPASQVDGRR